MFPFFSKFSFQISIFLLFQSHPYSSFWLLHFIVILHIFIFTIAWVFYFISVNVFFFCIFIFFSCLLLCNISWLCLVEIIPLVKSLLSEHKKIHFTIQFWSHSFYIHIQFMLFHLIAFPFSSYWNWSHFQFSLCLR